jgi:hypothetical protein
MTTYISLHLNSVIFSLELHVCHVTLAEIRVYVISIVV